MMKLRLSAGFSFLISALLCFGSSPKVAPDLVDVDPHSIVSVIVQFAGPPDDVQIRRLGGVHVANLDPIPAHLYTVPARALDALANNPNVVYISPDRQVEATLDYANPTAEAPMAFASGWNGTGVGVAIIDSGILQENDLLATTTNASNVSRIV